MSESAQRSTQSMAILRRFYWKRVRRYRYETCGSIGPGGEARATIKRYGCGRPIGPVWGTESDHWNRVVTGKPLAPGRTEGAGGILCVRCFDQACRDRGEYFMWTPGPI